MAKKLLALSLAIVFALSLAACDNAGTPTSSKGTGSAPASGTESPSLAESEKPKEIVSLQIASIVGDIISGDVMKNWWQDVLREDLGIQLEFLGGDAATLLASGELPDIFIPNNNKDMTNAIAGDLLVCLDDHQDKLPNVFQNAEASLRYWRENLSEGTGKAYAVGDRILTVPQSAGTAGQGPFLRWDIYQKIGAPELNTFEDYLTVLEEMQKANPTTEDGQKVYALGLFPEWDGNTMSMLNDTANLLGTSIKGYIEVHFDKNNEIRSIFDDDSTYMRLLQFYFNANQKGLLDPDSMTMPFDTYREKLGTGRLLFSSWSWGFEGFNTAENQAAGIGFQPVFSKDLKVVVSGINPTGNIWPIGIGKAGKHLDEALAYLDYLYSYDGLMKLLNGPQGVIWDLDEAGKPYITEQGYGIIANGSELPGGGTLNYGISSTNAQGLNSWSIHPSYNLPLERNAWPKKDFAPADTALVQSWKEFYGAEDQIRYLTAHDSAAVTPYAPMESLPDEIQQIDSRVAAIVPQLSWKMIYAKDEAEFEALKTEMIEQAQGMGVQQSIDWYTQAFNKGLEAGKKYS